MRRDRRRERKGQFQVEPLEGRIAPGFILTNAAPAVVAATDAETSISRPASVSINRPASTVESVALRPAEFVIL
jgi:hypothetical protein